MYCGLDHNCKVVDPSWAEHMVERELFWNKGASAFHFIATEH
jgi:hypothetical protein